MVLITMLCMHVSAAIDGKMSMYACSAVIAESENVYDIHTNKASLFLLHNK